MFRHLVVAVDFSPCSLRALTHALYLSRTSGGQITLLHVLEFLHTGEQVRAQARLDEAARQGRRLPACVVKPVHADGVTATILAVTAQRRGDVIVMGAHGQPQLDLPRLGQVARGVLLHSPVPVQIVPQGPERETLPGRRWHTHPTT